MNNRLFIILTGALLLGSCRQESAVEPQGSKTREVSMSLAINTLASTDPLSINGDDTFSSLAIYIYNDDAGSTLDKSALLPLFTSVSTRDVPVQAAPGTKTLYLIANYVGKTFRLTDGSSLTLSTSTTKQQLDNITGESVSEFSPTSLLMVGKQTLSLTQANDGSTVEVALRRLQARVDVHVFKGPNFGTNNVILESITLHNKVFNSEIKFDNTTPAMLTSPIFNTQLIANGSVLQPYVAGVTLQPATSQAIFYSYQNLVTAFAPLQMTAPYLEIKLNSNGVSHTYKGYFTDNDQLTNKYSLLQNNVYQITALLDVDSKITLNMTVLPWNKKSIEYERPITSNDFAFGPWGTSWGGINGKTMNTNVGGLEDAAFLLELKAPMGAAWTATLTNGLDFSFTSSTAGTTTAAVSKGFTNIGNPYLIAVRANKRWTGETRQTEFYITVEGNEIPINPIVGSQRLYDGTDTRIKITQVASYN